MQILIIDDDIAFRKAVKNSLDNFWYSIFEAEDGHQGLKIVENNPIDVVICDIFMPEEDKMEFLVKIKGLKSRPKIIMVSGGGSVGDICYLEIAKNLGVGNILRKPIQIEQLHSYIEELLK